MRSPLNLMLWGAGLGWVIASGVGQIREAIEHEGSGRVDYEYTSDMVDEHQYKRHNVVMGIFAIGLGAVFWVLILKTATNTKENENHDV